MESLIVHPKNQMEATALKNVLKEMGIRFEKFHTRNTQKPASAASKNADKKSTDKPKQQKK